MSNETTSQAADRPSRNNKRIVLVVVIVAAVAVVGAAGWYLGSPLFINRAVNEAFPVQVPSAAEMEGMSAAELAAMEQRIMDALPSPEALAELPEPARERIRREVERFAAAMPERPVAEPMPGPELLASGEFQDADRFHKGSGTALLYRIPGMGNVLRFERFSATNGPDLRVLLAAGARPTNRGELGEYLELGSLKGNVGDQNYTLPEDADPARYASVVIYCRPFQVVFATATLTPAGGE